MLFRSTKHAMLRVSDEVAGVQGLYGRRECFAVLYAYQDDLVGAIQKRLEQRGLYRVGRINQPVGWMEQRVKVITDVQGYGVLHACLPVCRRGHVWEKTLIKYGQQLVKNVLLAHGVSSCLPSYCMA